MMNRVGLRILLVCLTMVALVVAIGTTADARVTCGVYCTPEMRVLPEPEPPAPYVVPEPWASLAECESHGEWDYSEASGWGSGLYDGGLQFDPGTWTAFGGGEYAPTADRATPQQQVEIAERVLAAQGWKAWPACSLALGLR